MLRPTKPGLAAALGLCALLLAGGGKKALSQSPSPQPQPRVLVFSKTAGFRHASIPDGVAAIRQLGAENNFWVNASADAALFRDDSLKAYAAVVFLSTTGDVLNNQQEAAFERYILAGGGFAGVHAAADTEYDWPWYNRLLGAYFLNHPAPQTAVIDVKDKNHPSTATLPDRWQRYDEWYNFKALRPEIRVLATLDETSYQGGTHGEDHPITWYQTLGCGRSWYTALGHTRESYREPLFLQHLLGGIQYAIGNGQTCAVLPVSLTGFTATLTPNREVALTWQTSAEGNTGYFVVERSADLSSFQAIGTVQANGVASTYSFRDRTPSHNTVYYRLRQVDKDGTSRYSTVVPVRLPQGFSFSFSPNPSSGRVQVSTNAPAGEDVRVQVVDRTGNRVYAQLHQGPQFSINLTGLPAGTYLIRIGKETKQLLLVK